MSFNIENLFLFNGISDAKRKKIISLLPRAVDINKGEYIYTQHNFENSLGIILSGEAKVNVPSDQATRVVMKRLYAGDIFGVAALFDSKNYVSDIFTLKPCKILLIPQQLLLEIFEKYPICSINYIKALTSRIKFLNERVSALSRKDAVTKVHQYLISCVQENRSQAKNMQELSKMLGIGRTSLYRAVEALENDGIIARSGHEIILIQKGK